MNELIAYCGLDCEKCPIYEATRITDKKKQKKMRIEIMELLKNEHGMNYRLEEITDCDGCRTETNRLFSACKNCPIKDCSRKKGLESCALCDHYACKNLENFFVKDPSAKVRLDEIRNQRK